MTDTYFLLFLFLTLFGLENNEHTWIKIWVDGFPARFPQVFFAWLFWVFLSSVFALFFQQFVVVSSVPKRLGLERRVRGFVPLLRVNRVFPTDLSKSKNQDLVQK